jgi:hypothetical protein
MPRYGEHGDPTPRCVYCGKPEIKVIWSGPRRQYCSYKCMAAGEYHCTFLCSLCTVPIAVLFGIGIIYGLLTAPQTLDIDTVLVSIIIDLFALFPVITTYHGWKIANQ